MSLTARLIEKLPSSMTYSRGCGIVELRACEHIARCQTAPTRRSGGPMCRFALVLLAALTVSLPRAGNSQNSPRVLVAVLAHPDDETPIGPILARYAREGVQVHLVIATDGAEGASNTTIPRGPELAK